VLVTGATGYIGGRLVPRLLARGHEVVCLVRDPGRLAGRRWARVERVKADVLDRGSLDAALKGVDTAYYLVHSMHAGERGFVERDRAAARNFAAAARAAGVRHIIYLGALGRGELSSHLASRQETGQILRETGVSVTELRAAVIIGPGSASFELMRSLVDRLPVMVCPRWVTTRCQPIAVDDVLHCLVQALEAAEVRGSTLEIGGADVLTYADMMLGYAAVAPARPLHDAAPVVLVVRSRDPHPRVDRPPADRRAAHGGRRRRSGRGGAAGSAPARVPGGAPPRARNGGSWPGDRVVGLRRLRRIAPGRRPRG
jgi:uncharacterized protein YbjT (DUF2867 family)